MSEVLDRAEQRGLDKGIYALIDAYREDMALDDQSIIRKLATRFSLTEDQAAKYVAAGAAPKS